MVAKGVSTVKAIEALAPRSTRYEVKVSPEKGLWVAVQPTGAKSFCLRYRFAGKHRKLTLGSLSLAEARQRAREAANAIEQGVDPATRQQAQKLARAAEAAQERADVEAAKGRAPDRVEAVVEEFIKRHVSKLRSEYEVARALRRDVAGPWKGRRLSEITRADVHALLDLVRDRGAETQANRLHAYVSRLCAWAVSRGIIERNPIDGVEKPSKEKKRERVLDDKELAAVWRAAESVGGPFSDIIRLLILTGQRKGEIVEATWPEVDFEARLLRLAGDRVKNGRAHNVPLSARALAVFEGAPRIAGEAGFVFTTNGKNPVSGFSKWKARLDSEIKKETGAALPEWTIHDLRRSTASGLQRSGIPLEVIERILNHVSGSFAGIVEIYQRHKFENEMRAALDGWARHVDRVLTGDVNANVIELAAARQ